MNPKEMHTKAMELYFDSKEHQSKGKLKNRRSTLRHAVAWETCCLYLLEEAQGEGREVNPTVQIIRDSLKSMEDELAHLPM